MASGGGTRSKLLDRALKERQDAKERIDRDTLTRSRPRPRQEQVDR